MVSGLTELFVFWLFTVAGLLNQQQGFVIDYLLKEN